MSKAKAIKKKEEPETESKEPKDESTILKDVE
jgi:hypothetical protein